MQASCLVLPQPLSQVSLALLQWKIHFLVQFQCLTFTVLASPYSSSTCIFASSYSQVTPLLTLTPSQRCILPAQSISLPSTQWQLVHLSLSVFSSQNLYVSFFVPLLLQSRSTWSSTLFNKLSPNNFFYSYSRWDGTAPWTEPSFVLSQLTSLLFISPHSQSKLNFSFVYTNQSSVLPPNPFLLPTYHISNYFPDTYWRLHHILAQPTNSSSTPIPPHISLSMKAKQTFLREKNYVRLFILSPFT